MALGTKLHGVLMLFPAQSHIKGLLKFAKGSDSLDTFLDFRFEAIPDGLPPSDPDATQAILELVIAIKENATGPPFIDLVKKLNAASSASSDNIIPSVSCIISDGAMPFVLDDAQELGVPCFSFFTVPATTLMSLKYIDALREKGLSLHEETYLTNGYLETTLIGFLALRRLDLRTGGALFK